MDKEDVCIHTHTHTHTHTQTNIMEYYSVINKKDNAICSNMDSKRDYHTK